MEPKEKCYLEYVGNTSVTGELWLTKSEYMLVKRVVNTDNWENVCFEPYVGELRIYCPEFEEE